MFDNSVVQSSTLAVKSIDRDSAAGRPIHYYRPRSVASEGYVFTGVCHSVTEGGGREGGVNQGHGHNTPPPPQTWTWDLVTTPPSLSPPRHGHGTWSQHPPPPPTWTWDLVTTPPSLPPPRTWTWDLVTTPPSPPQTWTWDLVTTPPSLPPRTIRRWAVRILLECILVSQCSLRESV